MQPCIHLHILASGSKGNAAVVEGPEGMVLIDCGITRRQLMLRADALGLESNHDAHMLATGPYPGYLKARVGGQRGHLSNDQCAQALQELVCEQTTTVVALHISENNNLPSLAKATLAEAVPESVEVLVAAQSQPMTVW